MLMVRCIVYVTSQASNQTKLTHPATPRVALPQVCEGTYRGFGDTMTPLPIAMSVALVNLILDPLLIFAKGQGGA